MVEPLKKTVDMTFEQAVERIETLIVEQGFSHIATKRLDNIFKEKLGIEDYPQYAMILGCGAEFAKAALDVSKDVGLLFPCSFVVYVEEDKVWVGHISIMKIAPALGLAPAAAMAPVIEKTGTAVHMIWDML
ncbi:MAG: DUF302 domain-containing protein [bacterium]|nr:DUF302 domain-containing protein [bacterium]